MTEHDTEAVKADYRHTRRLLVVFVGLIAVGAIGRCMAVPKTFGQYGYYRGAALGKAKLREPRYLGKETCGVAGCHAKQAKLHAKDAHGRVQCEDCHGPGRGHIVKGKKARKMKVEKGKQLCLTCHQHLAARPSSFPQITVKDHFAFVGVKDTSIGCTTCHEPHEPLFMDHDLRKARLHPVVHRCRDCHATGPERDPATKKPKDHPAIFDCSYCHKAVAKDFAKRSHKQIRCTTCHIFFRESAFAGRIMRDTDPRFCLLCHQDAKFRSNKKGGPPHIKWPSHRAEMGSGAEDAKKVCVDCHRDNIHRLFGRSASAKAAAPASAPASAPAAAGAAAATVTKPTKRAEKKGGGQ